MSDKGRWGNNTGVNGLNVKCLGPGMNGAPGTVSVQHLAASQAHDGPLGPLPAP